MKIGLFLGCNMPAIRPDSEKGVRSSLKNLGIEIEELEGATCCPAFGTFWSVDENAALLVNAWNLAIAESKGVDLVVQCGGCYSSLKIGRFKLLNGKLDEINRILKKVGMKYTGKANVRHITEFLHNAVGIEKIKDSLKYSMEGLKAVVQVPCHVIRPSKIVGFDDPEDPKIMRNLVEALGAKSPKFSRWRQCCGGAGGFRRLNKVAAKKFLKTKLDAMKEEVDPDCIVVSCVTCLIWIDSVQAEMRKEELIDYEIPVFDYCQLLAICQGEDPKKVASISEIPRDEVVQKILESRI